MSIAIITLSPEGALLAARLGSELPDSRTYMHRNVPGQSTAERFSSITELTARIFHEHAGIVFISACGVAVRAVAPLLKHKTIDPAVVVVDVRARWAVSLVSGHEGGANDLAIAVSNVLFSEAVITTATEALKTLIVGVGCRKGTTSGQIVTAVNRALAEADLSLSDVRLISSADIKKNEQGLLDASRELDIPLKFISSVEIRNCLLDFRHSDFVVEQVKLPAVAEPCALLAGRKTKLLVEKKSFNGVTVAVAQESCLS